MTIMWHTLSCHWSIPFIIDCILTTKWFWEPAFLISSECEGSGMNYVVIPWLLFFTDSSTSTTNFSLKASCRWTHMMCACTTSVMFNQLTLSPTRQIGNRRSVTFHPYICNAIQWISTLCEPPLIRTTHLIRHPVSRNHDDWPADRRPRQWGQPPSQLSCPLLLGNKRSKEEAKGSQLVRDFWSEVPNLPFPLEARQLHKYVWITCLFQNSAGEYRLFEQNIIL